MSDPFAEPALQNAQAELSALRTSLAQANARAGVLSEALVQLRTAMIEEHGCYPTDRNTRVGHIICDAMEAADKALAATSIKDRNGEVVLGLCRRCNRGEIELYEPCVAQEARPKWRDMKDAPMDGTVFLAVGPDFDGIREISFKTSGSLNWAGFCVHNHRWEPCTPTLWQPLPSPPDKP